MKLEKKIFDKYLEKDEEGNPIQAQDETGNPNPGAVRISNVESFNKEMFDLMSIENTVEYEKVNFDELNLTTAKIKDLIKICCVHIFRLQRANHFMAERNRATSYFY
jgi:hypothetical protein